VEEPAKETTRLNRILTVLFVLLLLVLVAVFGYIFYRYQFLQDDSQEDDLEPMDGFVPDEQLSFPRMAVGSPNTFEVAPLATAQNAPGYQLSMQWYFLNNSVYQHIGSILKMSVENTGNNVLFVFQFGIQPYWSEDIYMEATGYYIDPGEEKELGMAPFPGPGSPGNYEYSVGVSVMAQDKSGKWYDYDWTAREEKDMEVQPIGSPGDYDVYKNPKLYYEKLLPFFEDDERAGQKAKEITSDLEGTYNIHQVCRVFDFVVENIEYICDPDDEDVWSSPDDTLASMGGDCEDQAILVASMVQALGGDVRIHFTPDHAYASFFAGNNESLKYLASGISRYYNIERNTLSITSYHDGFGNWIVLDPTVDFCPGSPPLGSEPVDGIDGYRWDFVDIEYVMNMDIPRAED
jgi:transglutaminase-like putative cysteine protease